MYDQLSLFLKLFQGPGHIWMYDHLSLFSFSKKFNFGHKSPRAPRPKALSSNQHTNPWKSISMVSLSFWKLLWVWPYILTKLSLYFLCGTLVWTNIQQYPTFSIQTPTIPHIWIENKLTNIGNYFAIHEAKYDIHQERCLLDLNRP